MSGETSTRGSLGIVQRVDLATNAAALHLRAPGRSLVVMIANAFVQSPVTQSGVATTKPFAGGAAILDAEARASWPSARLPLPASPDQPRARTLLVGGHLIALTSWLAVVSNGGTLFVLAPDFAAAGRAIRRVRLRTADDRDAPMIEKAIADMAPNATTDAFFEALRKVGQELGPVVADWAVLGARHDVQTAISAALVHLDKRARAVRGDLARIGDADRLAAQASWFVAEAARAPRGATSLTVTDWSTGEPLPLTVPLDPGKPARVQIDAMFHRARRLKKGAAIAGARLAETEAQIATLRSIADEVKSTIEAPDLAAVIRLAERARRAAPRDVKLDISKEGAGEAAIARRSKGKQEPAPPFRTFLREDGTRILVGRGAEKNDRLTFQIARPHDLWLHAKGKTGAHVIVPLSKSAAVTGELLADAALLAAHFSDARDEGVVDVEYTPRKYLKKPRGGAAGLVTVEREKVLALRMNEARRKALLEREEV